MKIALPTGYRPHQSLIKQTTFTAVMVKCSLDSETVFTVCQRKGRKIKQNNGTVQKKKKGEGNGSPLQYSCLENCMDRGAQWSTVHEVAKVGLDLVTKPPQRKQEM